SVSGAGQGGVTSSPSGISCASGTCSALYLAGTNVTLSASPDANSLFAGWGGACSGTAGCSVLMNQAQSVTASFAAATWDSLGGTLTSELSCVSWTGRDECFVRGTDGALYHQVFDGSGGHGWFSLGGGLSSAPSCVSWTAGRIDCFIRGI